LEGIINNIVVKKPARMSMFIISTILEIQLTLPPAHLDSKCRTRGMVKPSSAPSDVVCTSLLQSTNFYQLSYIIIGTLFIDSEFLCYFYRIHWSIRQQLHYLPS